MVCRCRDGTYGPECCSKGGRSSRPGLGTTSPATHSTYGNAGYSAGRRLNTLGKIVQATGYAQYTNSYLSQPKASGKIWTNLMVSDVKKRGAHYGARDPLGNVMAKNKRKYDWRPRSARNYIGYKDVHKRKWMHESPREAHRKRAPSYGKWSPRRPGDPKYRHGIYSQVTPVQVRKHQRGQRRRGVAKIGTGTAMRTLGKGLMFYSLYTYAKWLYEDPSLETVGEIAYDVIGGNQAEAIAATQDRSSLVFPIW